MATRRGFILPAVVALIAIAGLVAFGGFQGVTYTRRALDAASRDVAFQRDTLSVDGELTYLFATEPLGPPGLRVNGHRITREEAEGFKPIPFADADPNFVGDALALDGRAYAWSADRRDIVIAVQDVRGLVSVNGDPRALGRLVERLGGSPEAGDTVADRFADYLDVDQRPRLRGGEDAAYQGAGLALPLGRALEDEADAYAVLAWPPDGIDLVQFWSAAGVRPPTGINLNAAPALALQAQFDLAPEQAARAVEQRSAIPFRSIEDFQVAVGERVDSSEFDIYTFPGNRFRISVRGARPSDAVEFEIEVTPSGSPRPIWVRRTRSVVDEKRMANAAAAFNEKASPVVLLPRPKGLAPDGQGRP